MRHKNTNTIFILAQPLSVTRGLAGETPMDRCTPARGCQGSTLVLDYGVVTEQMFQQSCRLVFANNWISTMVAIKQWTQYSGWKRAGKMLV